MVFVSAAVVASRNAHHGRQERAVTEVAYAMLNADRSSLRPRFLRPRLTHSASLGPAGATSARGGGGETA